MKAQKFAYPRTRMAGKSVDIIERAVNGAFADVENMLLKNLRKCWKQTPKRKKCSSKR